LIVPIFEIVKEEVPTVVLAIWIFLWMEDHRSN